MQNIETVITSYVKTAVRDVYKTTSIDPAHTIDHTERVVGNTLAICRGDQISSLIPLLSAWLHDVGKPAEYIAKQRGEKLHHAEESTRQVPGILHPFREALGEGAICDIQKAVASHSKLNSPDDDLTTKILKDADRLDGLGSVGLYRTILSAHGNPLCNLSDPFPNKRIARGNETSQETTLAQTMLYTLEWFAMLRMPSAIRIGSLRVQKQIGFLEGLVEELGLSRDLLEQNEIVKETRGIISSKSIF